MDDLSKHLDERRIDAINRIGDLMIPGDEEMPSFSSSRCVNHVDRILDYMPAPDLEDLKMLLGVFSFLPGFLIKLLLKVMEANPSIPGLSPVLRLVRLGLRGLVMSLYYGDEEVLKKLKYEVGVYVGDR